MQIGYGDLVPSGETLHHLLYAPAPVLLLHLLIVKYKEKVIYLHKFDNLREFCAKLYKA